ncbi:hypothetical protein H5410_020396 [Solanum commersonii]|uniref:Uncharacterized protein n=1 Tax=Solanum commersonii TaxID=4109 RepID=A0A9J5Z7W6_SOLCO|nr:hypothetical protein H5410_020396 [Solanum commersonii]
MMALLWREGSIHAIDGKYPDNTSDSNKEKIKGDSLSVIQLSLAPNILCEAGRALPGPVSDNKDVVTTTSSHI